VQALTYHGSKDVRVETVNDPVLVADDDIILGVTATAICGAATYGIEPIDFDKHDDPAAMIIEATANRGVDASIDAVGFEAKGSAVETALTAIKLEGSSGAAIRQAMAATRRGGIVSVPGVYAGWIHGFLFGDAFEKGLTFKGGQTHMQRYMPELLERITRGELRPEAIITHRLPLAEAARGYQIFNDKEEECRKVVLSA